MGLLGQDLHRSVLVDGDRSGADEKLFDGALVLVNGDDARLEERFRLFEAVALGWKTRRILKLKEIRLVIAEIKDFNKVKN